MRSNSSSGNGHDVSASAGSSKPPARFMAPPRTPRTYPSRWHSTHESVATCTPIAIGEATTRCHARRARSGASRPSLGQRDPERPTCIAAPDLPGVVVQAVAVMGLEHADGGGDDVEEEWRGIVEAGDVFGQINAVILDIGFDFGVFTVR